MNKTDGVHITEDCNGSP